MHVVIIGGASTIGVTVTYTLLSMDPMLDVTLVDPDEATAWGHALDIVHSRICTGISFKIGLVKRIGDLYYPTKELFDILFSTCILR